MNDLRIGVIGVGSRGTLAKYSHKPGRGSRIVAGADPYKDELNKFSKKYPKARLFDDYKDLLQDDSVDAVFICSPDFCHEEQTLAALEAGKAVYLEKPMAITIEGCDKILDCAKRTGGKLYLGHNMRHFPSILKMKELIDKGVIGEVQAVWCRHFVAYGGDAYFKDWHSEQKYTTGLLLQKGAHDIDVIHWLAGGYTVAASGMGKLSVYDKCKRRDASVKGNPRFQMKNWPPLKQKDLSPVIDVEDHSMVHLQLDNGVQVSYTQCHYSPDAWRNYTFIGTKGKIENVGDMQGSKITVYTKRRDRFMKPTKTYRLRGGLGGHGGADPQIVKRFIDYVRDGVEPNTSPIAARNAVAAGVKATESIRDGGGLKEVPSYKS